MKRPAYVLCIERGDYKIDLWKSRVYQLAKSYPNDPPQMLRIIDESGEDYLYPADWFVPVQIPQRAVRALATTAAR